MTALAGAVVVFVVSTLARDRGGSSAESIVLKDVRVQVLNGCGIKGVGGDVANALRMKGYDVVEVGNTDAFDFSESIVIDRVGKGGRAREIAVALGVDNVIMQRVEALQYEATVIVGRDFRSRSYGREPEETPQ